MAETPNPPPMANGWNEYKRLVLHEIERLNNAVEKLAESHDGIRTDLTSEIHKASLGLAGKITDGFKDLDTKFTKETNDISKQVETNKREIAVMKAKAVVWGSVAAAVVAGVIQVLSLIHI